MTERYAEIIKFLEKEMHAKRLNYEDLAQINPEELPKEELPRYIAEYKAALSEWRRASMFVNTMRRSVFDASTIISLLTAKDLRSSSYMTIEA